MNNEQILPLLLVLIIFVYLSIYTLPINIHGDGKWHTLISKKITETGSILSHHPYQIMSSNENDITFYPITYPLVFHVMGSLFYMMGEDMAVKLSSPFFGALIALFIYLIFKDTNKYIGFFSALFAIILNGNRFIMVPLMEQYLLFAMVSSIYSLGSYFKTRNTIYILLTGLFLGLLISIKMQGMYLSAIVLFYIFLKFGYEAIKNRSIQKTKAFALLLFILVLISSIPLYDQIERNGTFGFVPGSGFSNFIPDSLKTLMPSFLDSKYPEDPIAQEVRIIRVGYWPEEMTLSQSFQQFILFPRFYNMALSKTYLQNTYLWMLIFSILLLFGFQYLFKKDRNIPFLLLLLFISEIVISSIFTTRAFQYHVVGISILAIFSMAGLFKIGSLIRALPYRKMIVPFILLFLITNLTTGYTIFIHETLWKNEGRETDYHLYAYKQMGEFVKSSTPKDAIFLAAETNFKYYCERNAIWINEGGGAKIPTIFSTDDQNGAIKWLKHYNIHYIFIDKGQTQRNGLYDYIPPHGLLDYIDKSPYFKKLYSYPPKEEILILYEVVYE